MKRNFNMVIPLTKVDEEKRLVYGRATQEVLDKDNEKLDYDSSKPNFEDWSGEFAKTTDGKSYGNIREQHDPKKACGKLAQPLTFDDEEKAIDVCAKIVSDDTWNKVKEGVLTGFSIGGSYSKRWKDNDGVTRYTAVPCEISIVDNPCCPTATIEFVKADGTVEHIKPKEKDMEINKTILDDFKKAIADKDLAKAFSFEEIRNRLQGAINTSIHTPFNCGYFWIVNTYPDHVIIKGDMDGDGDEDLFSIPYAMSADGEVEIGSDIQQVKVDYIPTVDEDGDDEGEELGESAKSAETDGLEKSEKRDDVDDADKKRAEGKYGDVEYADEENKKYPLDTKEHVEAAARYFGMPKNREKYSEEDQKKIDAKIASAEKKLGVGDKKDDKKETEKTVKVEMPTLTEKEIEDLAKGVAEPKTAEPKKEDPGEFLKKTMTEEDVFAGLAKALEDDLKKSGAKHSKETIASMQKISHAINEMGGACKCDKCTGIYKAEEGAEKSAESDGLAKVGSLDEKLTKAMERFESLEKSLTGLKTENEALQKKVDDLENQPMPGGAIVAGGTQVMEKDLKINSGNDLDARIADIDKVISKTNDPNLLQKLGIEKANLSMKKLYGMK